MYGQPEKPSTRDCKPRASGAKACFRDQRSRKNDRITVTQQSLRTPTWSCIHATQHRVMGAWFCAGELLQKSRCARVVRAPFERCTAHGKRSAFQANVGRCFPPLTAHVILCSTSCPPIAPGSNRTKSSSVALRHGDREQPGHLTGRPHLAVWIVHPWR